jgi:hypothetical protein
MSDNVSVVAVDVETVNAGVGSVNVDVETVNAGVGSVNAGVGSVNAGVGSVNALGVEAVNVSVEAVNVSVGSVNALGIGEIDINKVISFLKNFNYVNDVITKKLCITITEEQNTKLTNILEYLCTDIHSKLPLKNMIQQIKVIFDDNKIDIYDIPTIIEIITTFFNTNMSSVNVQNITVDDIALCIKVLLIIFIETNVVGNNMNIDLSVILKLFDSSLKLLKLHINVKNKLCINFFNCCKK